MVTAMRHIFSLEEELIEHPEEAEEIRCLTLNQNKPTSGLKGAHGLYGTPAWWQSIKNGTMPQKYVQGTIIRLLYQGMENGEPNAFELQLQNNSVISESFYYNNSNDLNLFRVGKKVKIFYAFDPTKRGFCDELNPGYAKIVVDIWISE